MSSYLLFAIVQKGDGSRLMSVMRDAGASGGTICYAKGTATSSILSVLGLGESRKEVLMSLLDESVMEKVLSSAMNAKCKNGVAIIMDANIKESFDMQNDWEMIEVIVEKGYSEDAKFFGISIVPEKEILLIVASRDVSEKVMEAIRNLECLKKKGMGILFTIPVRNFVPLG